MGFFTAIVVDSDTDGMDDKWEIMHLGKRDYGLFLLVVRLGLRASDIRNLRLNNIDWNRKKIVIIQINPF